MGYDPSSSELEQYTTPLVEAELPCGATSWIRFKMAVEAGKLKVDVPSLRSLNEVEDLSRKTGDVHRLSKTDIEVLALAFELSLKNLDVTVVSDDYSIQNLAEKLHLQYVSLATLGIRYSQDWILLCPACRRRFAPDFRGASCPVCGTTLKRKSLRRRPATGKSKGERFGY
jgi:UPF0271 protein